MPPARNIAAIGLKAKTGRAICVVVGGSLESPEFIKRCEVSLTDPKIPATFQPYHEVMELPWKESQIKVKPYIRAIEKVATKALGDLIHELRSQGLTVVRVGIVGSADRDLSKIGNFHIRARRGRTLPQVLEQAAVKTNFPPQLHRRRSRPSRHRIGSLAQNSKSRNLGRNAGPPWH